MRRTIAAWCAEHGVVAAAGGGVHGNDMRVVRQVSRMDHVVMGELFALIAAGVLTPDQPTAYELADGPKALTELETRAPSAS